MYTDVWRVVAFVSKCDGRMSNESVEQIIYFLSISCVTSTAQEQRQAGGLRIVKMEMKGIKQEKISQRKKK